MIESGGELYFPESAIMDALEMIYHEIRNIPIDQFEVKILQATANALRRIQEDDSQGFGEENTDCDCDDLGFDGPAF